MRSLTRSPPYTLLRIRWNRFLPVLSVRSCWSMAATLFIHLSRRRAACSCWLLPSPWICSKSDMVSEAPINSYWVLNSQIRAPTSWSMLVR